VDRQISRWRKAMSESPDPLLHRVPEAAWRLGLSRSTLYELIAAGELRVVRIGRAVRIPTTELTAWVQRQLADGAAVGSLKPNTDVGAKEVTVGGGLR
jgi:excisionase family DNA binding protein